MFNVDKKYTNSNSLPVDRYSVDKPQNKRATEV